MTIVGCTNCRNVIPRTRAMGVRGRPVSQCVQCYAWTRSFLHQEKVKERSRERARTWLANNGVRAKESQRARYAALTDEEKRIYIEHVWECNLKRRFGLTKSDFVERLNKQGGVCAICKRTSTQRFHVDHDHATGQVRSLLCGSCNRAIGLFADNPETVMAAYEYLKRWGR